MDLFLFYIFCTSQRFSKNACRPMPPIHDPSVCFECYTCLLMPFYKRALSCLLVLSMSLRVNRFDKNKQARALFNIFNGGNGRKKYTILMQLFECSLLPLFRSSCVFIRVAAYATSLHYSNIYENYVLKSRQSKHGSIINTWTASAEWHRLSVKVGEVSAASCAEI